MNYLWQQLRKLLADPEHTTFLSYSGIVIVVVVAGVIAVWALRVIREEKRYNGYKKRSK